jgi:hypothetical protein
VDPATSIGVVVAKAAGQQLGSSVGKRILDWSRGSEAKRLARLLKDQYPAASKMLTQPDALGQLWLYAETGVFDGEALLQAVKPITTDDEEARRLVEAVRTTTWQAVRDERRTHFELRSVRAELAEEIGQARDGVIERLDAALSRLGRDLPAARQLPAATERFVDRVAELALANEAATTPAAGGAARIVAIAGMAGIGKSALAIEVARRLGNAFEGGALYVDLRGNGGQMRAPSEVAGRLLRDLGVAAEAIPNGEGAVALLRSLLAELPVLLVLDNARRVEDVHELVPANPDSVVLITSQTPMAALQRATLISLDALPDADAHELLAGYVPERIAHEPEAAKRIVEACHGLPLAVTVVGARLRRRNDRPLSSFASTLDAGGLAAVDDPDGTIRSVLEAALGAASMRARRTLLLVAMLDVVDLSPVSLAALAGVSETDGAGLVEELEDLQLLQDGRVHRFVRWLLFDLAQVELKEEDVTSAQQRRVDRLVNSAQPHIDELEG